MSQVVRGSPAGRRLSGVGLMAAASAFCVVLGVVPTTVAAAAPSGIAVQQVTAAAGAVSADPVTGETTGATGRAGDPVTVTLLGADPESSPTSLTYTATGPNPSTILIEGDQLTYTPPDGGFGDQSFGYSVSNVQGDTADSTVTITVTHDAPPVAGNASVTTRGAAGRPGTPVTIEVRATDADPASLTYAVSDPAHGVATIGAPSTATGPATIIYTPVDGFVGPEVFTWSATDGHGEVGTGTVTVSVTANTAPTAPVLTAATRSSTSRTGLPVTVPLVSTDSDGDPISYELGAVTGGVATLMGPGASRQVVFTPAARFVGAASIAYTADDGYGGVTSGTITVTVMANARPAAPDVSAKVNGYTVGSGTVALLDLTATDPDDASATLLYELLNQPTPAQGILVQDNAALRFTPTRGYAGTVTFNFVVTDPLGDSDTGTATVVVNARPVGTTSTATTIFGRPVVIPLTATDDGPQQELTYAVSSPAEHGTTTFQNGVVSYRPDLDQGKYEPSFDSFVYTATDGDNFKSDPKLVTVTIRPNTAPVAGAVERTTRGGTAGVPGLPVELPLHAVDAEGDGIVFSLDAQPANGTAVLLPSGTEIAYTPAPGFVGTEIITYRVTDRVVVNGMDEPGLRASTTATAQVVVTADAPPTAPTVQLSTPGSTAGPGAEVTAVLTSKDPDAGDVPTFTVLSTDPAAGVAGVSSTGAFTFTPARGFSGPAVVLYFVASPQGAISTGVVVIDVRANRSPIAGAASARARGGTNVAGPAQAILLAARISDPDAALDHDRMTVTATADNGTVTVSGTTLAYRSRRAFAGTDLIHYRVTDGRGGSAQSTVTVSVAANRLPTLPALSRRVQAGSRVALTLLGSDPDGDKLVAYAVGSARKGSLTRTGNRVLFTAAPNYAGPVTVRTSVRDALGAVGSSTITFTTYGMSSFTTVTGPKSAVSTSRPTFTALLAASAGSVSGGTVTVRSGTVVLGSGRVAWNGTVTINSRLKLSAGRKALSFAFSGTATTGTATTLREFVVR